MKKLLFCSSMFFAMLLLHNFASAQCDASFSYIATSATTYHFSSNQPLQTGYTYYHTWRVDDNVWSHTTSDDYTFPQGGNYEVCHTISIQDAAANTICVDSACIYIQITTEAPCFPQVNVSAHATSPHTIQFSNSLADYTNVTIVWTYGDGTSDTGVAAPLHYYNQFGTYTACVRLTDTIRNCSWAYCRSVHPDTTIINPCQLNTYFIKTQPDYSTPVAVFTQHTQGTYHNMLWDYDDGTTSDTFQTTHQFPAFGQYQVCLTVTDTILGCTDNSCTYIRVDSCKAAFANFSGGQTTGPGQVRVYPTNLQGINVLSWQWDFGDSTLDSTHLQATHNYPLTDTFNVCFTVTLNGCAPVTNCKPIITYCDVVANYTRVMTGPNTTQFHSTSQGSNLAYLWSFGDGTYGDEQDPVHVYNISGTYNACLLVTDTVYNCTDTACSSFLVTALVDTICGHVFADYNYNGIQDATETGMGGISILCHPSGILLTTDSTGHYEGMIPWDVFYSGITTIELLYAPAVINTIPLFADSYQYSFGLPGIRQCGFDFGVATFSSRITGKVFADYDQDGIYDSGEGLIPNQLVRRGNVAAITGSDGTYILDTYIGTHNIWRDTTGAYAGIPGTPVSYTVAATQPVALYNGYDFGIGISNTYVDVAVDLIPLTPIALSHKVNYKLLATNLGPASPIIGFSMTHDAALTFDAANSQISYDAVSRMASTFGFISPFLQQIKDITFDITPGTVMNQNVYNTSNATVFTGTDVNLTNNNDPVHQIVVASFDPNNKLPDECGTGSEGYIQPNQKIKFVINFENTGTYYAMNVIVKDVLDANFDRRTFRYIGSSNPDVCDVKMDGDSIYFRFSNIRLPYTKPESQGWVAFEIAPKPNLPFNTQLHNTAAIYFDHNEPVVTNTTLHTIGGPEAITDLKEHGGVIAMPNPFSSEVTISTQHITSENCSYTLSDLLGHTVLAGKIATGTNLTIKRNNLPAGTYIVSVFSDKNRPVHLKIVAE